jgi:DNA-binding Lrp family transcriptional regulator
LLQIHSPLRLKAIKGNGGDNRPRRPLEPVDRRIIAILQDHGRITNQALAERINLSPSACLARWRRLEREGVIKGYAAQIATDLHESRVTAYVEVVLSHHHPIDLRRFEVAIAAMPQVVEAAEMSGIYDYMIKLSVADLADLRAVSDEMLSANIGILRMNTHLILKMVKSPMAARI